MSNSHICKAIVNKNDEFYTRYSDVHTIIESIIKVNPNVFQSKTVLLPCDDPEQSQFTKYFIENFERFGIKKLISTSYSGIPTIEYNSLFAPPRMNIEHRGKIFVCDNNNIKQAVKNLECLPYEYLIGNGDFRSDEITKFRDEADIIVTNPPFSLFQEFLRWLLNANKQFIIFSGLTAHCTVLLAKLLAQQKVFVVPCDAHIKYNTSNGLKPIPTIILSNIQPLPPLPTPNLTTMKNNLKYSPYKKIREERYPKYDNYEAIDVSYISAIPTDYYGQMGAPASFFCYNLPQFEVVRGVKSDLYINGRKQFTKIIIKRKP